MTYVLIYFAIGSLISVGCIVVAQAQIERLSIQLGCPRDFAFGICLLTGMFIWPVIFVTVLRDIKIRVIKVPRNKRGRIFFKIEGDDKDGEDQN